MKKPYILAIDDDLPVLRAVERDLRTKFASDYRILAIDSPQKALTAVTQLTARGDRIALFLVDQRMPQMSGTEFLHEVSASQPEARRVLLTAYADSSAAIDAINKVRLNHYLMKPWEPPEQHLYPVLADQLEDWQAGNRETFEGAYVVGTRWAPETHRLKDFLAKSQIPYRWIEPEGITDQRVLAALGTGTVAMPAVIFPDGSVLERPDPSQVAEKFGLATIPSRSFYDVVVIGAGPAGLACALYCSTEGLKTVLVEREAAGGQAGLSSRIENYLGFPSGLSGADLARRGVAQVRRFGTEVLAPAEAVGLVVEGEYRVVKLSNGQELAAHSVVIAAGVQWRRLDVPGMDGLTGAGVYYGAAITESSSCRDEDVYIVGGANSAGQAAVHFSEVARTVQMIVRGASLSKSMSHYLVERIDTIPNISVVPNAEVIEVRGGDRLEEIVVRRHDTQTTEVRRAGALFIFIGAEPHTDWLEGVLCRDGKGFLLTGTNLINNGKRPPGWNLNRDPFLLETSVPGVFAVGDVRDGAVRRVANSVGEGSIVLYFVRQYMRNRYKNAMTWNTSPNVTPGELLLLPLFDGESREAVEWIAGQMEARCYEPGDVVTQEGGPAQHFIVVLEGEIHFRRTGYDSLIVVPSGRATGVLPFSRVKTWIGRGQAAQPTRIALMDASHLRELVYRAPTLAQRLVSEMTDRTREFTRMEESSNRLLALGKLAAGLAHELNNPASAAVRSSARLRDVLTERRQYALALRSEALPEQVRGMLSEIGDSIIECAATPGALDAMERSDRESELADWLESVGVPGQLALELVDAGITAGKLRPLAALASREALTLGLRMIVAEHQVLCLSRELEEASRRISDLVQAVKSYSYMDQSTVAEVDIEQGIDVTLRMFQHQLKLGVQVSRKFARNLPRIRGNGSALNQIWTNLIDNALHAMDKLPKEEPRMLTVKTCSEPDGILVEISDNGPGIPAEVRSRIFEPFFTTKAVGEGTGLGLEIVQRIVRSHKGSIRVESVPGRTAFQVRLPVNRG